MEKKQNSAEKKPSLTPEQDAIVTRRGKNLLISASAGSGKTFVMIERIKNLIQKHEVKVDELLVVTFTKAAAGEMKARLIKGLEEIEDKDDYIKEQLGDMSIASICTLHSFCAKLLKTYFYTIGLDPAFILIDEIESTALKNKAIAKLIDDRFIVKDNKFFELLDIFSINRREENFKQILLKFYEFLLTQIDRDSWFKRVTGSAYCQDLEKNICLKIISQHVYEMAGKLKNEAERLLVHLDKMGAVALIEVVNGLLINLLKFNIPDFETIKKAVDSIEKVKDMPRKLVVEYEVEKEKVKLLKKKFTDFKEKAEEYVQLVSQEGFKDRLKITKERVENLYKYVNQFEEIYSQLKKEKVALDFSDLERYTLQLLKDGTVRQMIKDKYKYVFVDEYQDTNIVQEEILNQICGINNLFMVGDVKQSIYKFRASEPEIFVGKYNAYKKDGRINEAIDLNDNFRSHQDILEFANIVFEWSMTDEFGKVNYKRDAMLKKGDNPYPKTSDFPTIKLDVVTDYSSYKKQQEELILPDYSVMNHTELLDDNVKKAELEGLLIAQNIKNLIGKEYYVAKSKEVKTLEYKDIAILTASRGEYLNLVLKQLQNHGIPYSSDVSMSIFEDECMCIIKSMLMLINNSNLDIELLSVLNSEMFDFEVDELAQIREIDRESKFFYQALENALGSKEITNSLKKKLIKFVELREKFNFESKFKKVDELIYSIITKTGYYNKIIKRQDGGRSLTIINKLLTLLNGKRYNDSLSVFLDYIKENEISFELDSNDKGVIVTTIHKSKGLEYPVVILMGAGQDVCRKNQGAFAISKEMGVGIDYYDVTKRTKCKNIVKSSIGIVSFRDELEEKLRLLYVALTRAINHLIIVGIESKEDYISNASEAESFLDWILPAVSNYISQNKTRKIDLEFSKTAAKQLTLSKQHKLAKKVVFSKPNINIETRIEEVFNYQYPYSAIMDMPVKTNVSEMLAKDKDDYFVPDVFSVDNGFAIEKGLVYHKIMQEIDLGVKTLGELNKEYKRLVSEGKVSAESLKLVNNDDILSLLNNEKFKELTKSKVYREQEFIALTKVGNHEKDGIVVQGIIDFVAVTDDGIIVIDYKTNNWKNEQKYIDHYKQQLDIYAKVVSESFGKPIIKKMIYSFALKKFILL